MYVLGVQEHKGRNPIRMQPVEIHTFIVVCALTETETEYNLIRCKCIDHELSAAAAPSRGRVVRLRLKRSTESNRQPTRVRVPNTSSQQFCVLGRS